MEDCGNEQCSDHQHRHRINCIENAGGERCAKATPPRTPKASSAQSPAAMAGSAANAAILKVKISGILMDAIGGHQEKYRTPEGFIRWVVVEVDINETIDASLR